MRLNLSMKQQKKLLRVMPKKKPLRKAAKRVAKKLLKPKKEVSDA